MEWTGAGEFIPVGVVEPSGTARRSRRYVGMDPDEERSLSLGTEVSASVPPPSPLTGCYLLAIIGEPHTHEHKEIILQRLVKGTYKVTGDNAMVDSVVL